MRTDEREGRGEGGIMEDQLSNGQQTLIILTSFLFVYQKKKMNAYLSQYTCIYILHSSLYPPLNIYIQMRISSSPFFEF